jgi:hypothetical protein
MQLFLRRWPKFSRSCGISQCQRRSPSIFTSLGDISCGSTGNFSGPSPSNLFRIRANLKPQQVEPAWRTSRNSRTCVPQHFCGVGSFSQSRGIFTCRRRSPSIFASLGDISCGSAENFSGPRPTHFFTQPLALSCRTPEAALSQIFPGRGMDLQIPCMLRASPGKISACVTRSVCGECFCELFFRISAPAGSASTTRIFDGLRQVTCKSHDANRGTPNYPPLRKPWKFPGRLRGQAAMAFV